MSAKLKTAVRELYWHGTSSKFLRRILKNGLVPNPKKKIFDESDEKRTTNTRSMKTYGGVYIARAFKSSASFASGASRKVGGHPLYVAMTYESRSPEAMLDEDHAVGGLETVTKLSLISDLLEFKSWTGKLLRENDISSWNGIPVSKYVTVAGLIESADVDEVVTAYLNNLASNRPDVQRQLHHSKKAAEIHTLAEEAVRAFALHLLERYWNDRHERMLKETEESLAGRLGRIEQKRSEGTELEQWELDHVEEVRRDLRILKSGKKPSPLMEGTFDRLRTAIGGLSKRLKTLNEPPNDWAASWHSLRVQEPIGFKGKNRILLIVEEAARESKVVPDTEYKYTVRATDLIIRYGSPESPEFKTFLKEWFEWHGGSYRLIHKGKVLDTSLRDKDPWPEDLWGPAPQKSKAASVQKKAFISNPIIKLKNYLTKSDVEKGQEAAYDFPGAFVNWLSGLITHEYLVLDDDIKPAIEEMVRTYNKDWEEFDENDETYGYEYGQDVGDDFFDDLREKLHGSYSVDIPEILLTYFVEEFSAHHMWREEDADYAYTGYEDKAPGPPSWALLTFNQVIKNQWLIHFTNHAGEIAQQGFKLGVRDITRLGLTTWIDNDHSEKQQGGFNFAFLLKDFLNGNAGRGYQKGTWKYGNECVIFRASGVLCHHRGDDEKQAVFLGNTARDIIPVKQFNSKWAIMSAKRKKALKAFEKLPDAVKWIVNNYDQYRKQLKNPTARQSKVASFKIVPASRVPMLSAYEDEGWRKSQSGKMFWGSRGSGVLVVTDGYVLLLKRSSDVSEPNVWGVPGGAVPRDPESGDFKDDYESAFTEFGEETGIDLSAHSVKDVGEYVFRDGKFQYTTFIVHVPLDEAKSWRFRLNWENTDAAWVTPEDLEQAGSLHFGLVKVLQERGELIWSAAGYDSTKMRKGSVQTTEPKNIREAYISNPIIQLRDYLTMSDAHKGLDLVDEHPDVFMDWAEDSGIELPDRVHETYNEEGYIEIDLIPKEVGEEFYSAAINNEVPIRFGEHGDSPTWQLVDYRGLVKNQWLIHFTNAAHEIARRGFIHGIDDYRRLSLTTHFTNEAKKRGGYNFAYLLSDFVRHGRGRLRGEWKYGDECVIFRASGVIVDHHGDEEPQVIFWGKTARDIIPITQDSNTDEWGIGENRHSEPLFKNEDLEVVVKWAVANYSQYRKKLHGSAEKPKQVKQAGYYDELWWQAKNLHPIHVSCHLCHAQVGQPCRFGTDPGVYHKRRISATQNQWVISQPDVLHGLKYGAECTPDPSGICIKCGQKIDRLKNIPEIIAEDKRVVPEGTDPYAPPPKPPKKTRKPKKQGAVTTAIMQLPDVVPFSFVEEYATFNSEWLARVVGREDEGSDYALISKLLEALPAPDPFTFRTQTHTVLEGMKNAKRVMDGFPKEVLNNAMVSEFLKDLDAVFDSLTQYKK